MVYVWAYVGGRARETEFKAILFSLNVTTAVFSLGLKPEIVEVSMDMNCFNEFQAQFVYKKTSAKYMYLCDWSITYFLCGVCESLYIWLWVVGTCLVLIHNELYSPVFFFYPTCNFIGWMMKVEYYMLSTWIYLIHFI